MFDLLGQCVDVPLPGLDLPESDVSRQEMLSWEKELLGIYLSEHPFTLASRRLASKVDAFCGQIDEEMVGQTITTAGLVTSLRQSFTKDNRPFVTAILEDFAGSIEVTAWPGVFERTRDLWQEGQTLVVKGKVRSRNDRVQLTCYGVSLYQPSTSEEPVDEPEAPATAVSSRQLKISLPTSEDTDADIARLKHLVDLFKRFPGDHRVNIAIITGEGTTKVEMPGLATDYGPDLHRHLVELVEEQYITVEDIVRQN
jgi:DNA polymerase-3 subunit alpha